MEAVMLVKGRGAVYDGGVSCLRWGVSCLSLGGAVYDGGGGVSIGRTHGAVQAGSRRELSITGRAVNAKGWGHLGGKELSITGRAVNAKGWGHLGGKELSMMGRAVNAKGWGR